MSEQRIITQDTFGGPEVLRPGTAAVPDPLPTEIRVRVTAAGVNPVDAKTRSGRGMASVLGEPPFVLGWDVAGTVDAVGRGVTLFGVGDRVMGMPRFPQQAAAYAEYVTAPSRHFVATPNGLDDVHAGALPMAALTAWQSLVDTAHVASGDRVLVQGAGGGVGHVAVQIAKARGAHVVAVASAAKHDLLHDLGADELIDYRDADLAEATQPVDVVFDLVGGDATVASIQTLRRGGQVVIAPGGLADDARRLAEDRGVRLVPILVEPDRAGLLAASVLVADGRLRVHVSRTFPLADARSAHEAIESGHTPGKLVLTVGA
ncbi:NADP-dependent oxidoreductase [Egicoccus sp. AB-alg2]|uniref:NADP-dependent oxidoreductase n=1 Tax=Egicoccus sp. AB-alg2 TaxID=3242693 RepID=UPI00359CF74B